MASVCLAIASMVRRMYSLIYASQRRRAFLACTVYRILCTTTSCGSWKTEEKKKNTSIQSDRMCFRGENSELMGNVTKRAGILDENVLYLTPTWMSHKMRSLAGYSQGAIEKSLKIMFYNIFYYLDDFLDTMTPDYRTIFCSYYDTFYHLVFLGLVTYLRLHQP